MKIYISSSKSKPNTRFYLLAATYLSQIRRTDPGSCRYLFAKEAQAGNQAMA